MLPEDEISRLVREAEEHAKRDYAGYRRGVLWFAVLGYLYIVFVPLVLLLLMAGLVLLIYVSRHLYGIELQAMLGLAIALFAYLRALWVPFPPPTGVKLERGDYPELFNLVDELCHKLNIKVDYVMADDQFNAMVVQRPRLGLFGWYENYVVLGLPLMQALPPAHFRSVLAHEMGHVSGNHGKSSSFIYNQRVRLVQLLIAMHQHSQIALVMLARFYDWYYPRFSSSSLVIAREHEKQADRQSAEVTNGETSGEALILTSIKGAAYEKYWTSIVDKIRQVETPPDLIYFDIGEKLAAAPEDRKKGIEIIDDALKQVTNDEDTHPALSDRLRIVGFPEQRIVAEALFDTLPLANEKGGSAAEIYFGRKLPSLIQHFSDEWKKTSETAWKTTHRQLVEEEAQLLELTKKAETEELSVPDMVKMATLVGSRDGMEKALPYFEKVLEKDPNEGQTRYAIGSHYLETKDERGAEILLTLAKEKSQYGLVACSLLQEHYQKYNLKEELKAIEGIWQEYQIVLELAAKERQSLDQNDQFGPHDLTPVNVEIIVEQLQKHKNIKEAYLYCKVMKHLPDQGFYILAVVPKSSISIGIQASNEVIEQRLRTDIQLPCTSAIYVVNSDLKWMKDKGALVPGSLIYKA